MNEHMTRSFDVEEVDNNVARWWSLLKFCMPQKFAETLILACTEIPGRWWIETQIFEQMAALIDTIAQEEDEMFPSAGEIDVVNNQIKAWTVVKPQTFKQVMASEYASQWKGTMGEQLKKLHDADSWMQVPKTQAHGAKVLPGPDGSFAVFAKRQDWGSY
ncbi:hypothetical protein N7466_008664 [Penicillium verhagenii]|uniref:uncharacterized protein n=1 Tax=Penicillium verhagenii TaxID=1562060 RepID=UPI002545B68A|nr:uncharacterized protein N7466_008664 [Penicillium verhagenii]KAJ5924477.1 hypothetical protein N7466_008664 [Penicillium verhagenii]